MSADASALRDALRQRCGFAFTDAVRETGIELDVAAPFDTGELVDSKEVTETGGAPYFSARIAYPVIQAATTDQGARPHRIDGNPYLSFNVGGRQIVVRHVNHPGNAPTFWFSDGIRPIFAAQIQRQLAASL